MLWLVLLMERRPGRRRRLILRLPGQRWWLIGLVLLPGLLLRIGLL